MKRQRRLEDMKTFGSIVKKFVIVPELRTVVMSKMLKGGFTRDLVLTIADGQQSKQIQPGMLSAIRECGWDYNNPVK